MRQNHNWTPEQFEFIKTICEGRCWADIVKLFNKRFRLSLTPGSIRTYARARGLKNGLHYDGASHKKYTEKHIEYLRKIVPGRHRAESLMLFNERFGLSLDVKSFSSLCKRHGIKTGFTGHFEKGHVSHNKGKKGWCAAGSEKGWFQPGQTPSDWRPVGSERVTREGYTEIKVSDVRTRNDRLRQKNWKHKHVAVWEQANGSVPKSHVVIFADGNKQNFDLDNLVLISRKENAVLNHTGLRSSDKGVTKASVNLVKLKIVLADRKRGTLGSSTKRKLVILDNTGKRVFIAHDAKTKRYIAARETKHGMRQLRANLKPRKTIEEAQKDLIAYALKRGWYRI